MTTERCRISCVFTLVSVFLHINFYLDNAVVVFAIRIFTSLSDVAVSITFEPMHTRLIL